MSHRRESGAIPPWVIPEPSPRKSITQSESACDKKREPDALGDSSKQKLMSVDHQSGQGNYAWGDMKDDITKSQAQCLHLIGGEIVNNDCIQRASVLIRNGKIASIGKKLDVPKGTPTIDASGYLLMPGGIDMATYILGDGNTVNPKDYISVTKEALLGGTTTIVDTIICPKGQLPLDVFVRQKQRVEGAKLWCNVLYRLGLMEVNEFIIEQLETLVKKYNVTSFVFFISASEKSRTAISAGSMELKMALHRCRQLGIVPLLRTMTLPNTLTSTGSVDESTDPANTRKTIELAEETGCPLVVSSPSKLKIIEDLAKYRNRIPPTHIHISCVPSTLLPTITNGRQHPSRFLNYLASGDVAAISSDQSGAEPTATPAKLGAVGQRLVALWEASVPSGWLDASGFVQLSSTGAARLIGLYPRKGRISPGADADLVLWPANAVTQPGAGKPTMVILRGDVMAREGKLADELNESGPFITVDGIPLETTIPEPLGEVLLTEPFPMTVYSAVLATDRLRKQYCAPDEQDSWNMKPLANELSSQNNSGKNNNAPEPAMQTYEAPSSPNVTTQQETLNVRMVHGHRDLHASGFSLSGAQVDDNQPHRSGIRTRHPPGGQSRNPLW